jgi:hypothetical protein
LFENHLIKKIILGFGGARRSAKDFLNDFLDLSSYPILNGISQLIENYG